MCVKACVEKLWIHISIIYHQLYNLGVNNLAHMSNKFLFYNNDLALGAAAIDNSKGGGYETIRGDHSLKVNGSTYHFLSFSNLQIMYRISINQNYCNSYPLLIFYTVVRIRACLQLFIVFLIEQHKTLATSRCALFIFLK